MKVEHPIESAAQYLQGFQVHDGPVAVLIRLQEPVDALQATAAGHMLHFAVPQFPLHIRLQFILQHEPRLRCKDSHQVP